MNLTTLENSLRTISFLSIFVTMLLYWIKGSFFYTQKTTHVEAIAVGLCNILLVSILGLRWVTSHHFPLSNLYESLLFLSWGLLTFLFILQLQTKELFLGIIVTPIILFTTTFASFSLPTEMQQASSLVPALQSNWLMMHVTIMMLSYAALLCGSLLSCAFLVIHTIIPRQPTVEVIVSTTLTSLPDVPPATFLDTLDNVSYRTIGIGFPLLTIGILSGAVWANETWGSYWSWDPKETWAFITWLMYAMYLHSRIVKGWKGEKPALIASIGFLAVWICYLGVNIFGKGLHSYGWFEG